MPCHRNLLRWNPRPRSVVAPLAFVLAILLALAATVGPLSFAPQAHASSNGAILVSPAAGGPGTKVSLEIHLFSDTGGSYELRYTTAVPDQGGCASSRPVPVSSLNPFMLLNQPIPGTIAFAWPTILGSDAYYFCVFAATGAPHTPGATPAATPSPTTTPLFPTGELAHSIAPFSQTRDTTPQISVTLPGATTPTTGDIPFGATFTATITDWKSPQSACPAHLWLLFPDNISRQELPFNVVSPLDASRRCTLSVTAAPGPGSSGGLSPGQYVLLAGDTGIYQESAPLTFVTAAPPTTTPAATAAATPRLVNPGGPSQAGLSPLVLALSGLTLLIALGLVVVVAVLALRNRNDARRRALSSMGLDVEPLAPREPLAVHATERPFSRDETAWRQRQEQQERHERADDGAWMP